MSALPTFIGRYEVKQRLGQGGMGVIYLARDPAIDRLVALKLLNADIATEDLRQRFAQEARSSGALTHPHIVTLHDFGEVDGVPYLVMEYVQGETMAALIKRAAQIPVGLKLRWIEQACRALGYAHQRRVIHRDVKPSNLMIDEFETLKVVDFGIARSLGGGTTKLSTVIGTPGYMSPEQIQGGGIDARRDIFALGTVLYELLTYREAFGADSPHAVMHRVVSGEPQPLTELLTGPDLSIGAVVDTAMQKAPDERFQDMAQFEAAIRQARTALESTGRQLTLRTPGRPINQSRRRRTDPVDLARRRAEQIARHLEEAKQARQTGDFEAALAACENALLMDPSSVEALDLVEELRQESTGSTPRTTAAITAVAATQVSTTSTRRTTARPAPVADLAEMELRPAVFADRPTATGPIPMAAATLPSFARRRAWPWVALATVLVAAAAGVWAVQAGYVRLDGAEDDDTSVDLAMPDVPQVAVTTPAPTRATPPPRASAPARAPDVPSESPPAPASEPPSAEPAASAADAAPEAPPVEPPATTTPTPASPPTSPSADAAPEPPAAGPTESMDAPASTGPIDRDAVGRLLLRAEGAERNGNLAAALNLFREVLNVEPGNGIASRGVIRTRVAMLLRRAESLILVGDYPGALKELAAVAVYDPTNARAEELREAIEQGKSKPTPKKPGPEKSRGPAPRAPVT